MSDLAPFLDTLRDRVLLSSVVGKVVHLKRQGYEFQGCCPFHEEKTPSFTVNDRKRFYHCFGCGAHGDVVSFLMEYHSIPFLESVQQLSETAGIAMPSLKKEDGNRNLKGEKERLFNLLEEACKHFQVTLERTENALNYLKKRDVTGDVRTKYRLGYANESAIDVLLQKGYTGQEIVDAGIAPYPTKRINRFQDRLIIPILDRQKKVIAFGGRAMKAEQEAKYINSPETAVFHKSTTLFGLPFVGKMAGNNALYVVEGYFDVITCQVHGLNAVAPMGTALTQDHLHALWRLSFEPVLCFDGDAAGQKAALRACIHALPLLKAGYSLKILTLPSGEDPDSFLKKHSLDVFKELPAKSLSATLFEDYREKIQGAVPEIQAKFKKELTQALEAIGDSDVKDFYKKAFLQFNQDVTKPIFLSSRKNERAPFSKTQKFSRTSPKFVHGEDHFVQAHSPHAQNHRLEKIILATLLHHPTLIATNIEELLGVSFSIKDSDLFLSLAIESMESSQHDQQKSQHWLKECVRQKGLGRFLEALDINAIQKTVSFVRENTPFETVEQEFKDLWIRFLRQRQREHALVQCKEKLKENFDPKVWAMLRQIQHELLEEDNF